MARAPKGWPVIIRLALSEIVLTLLNGKHTLLANR
jgi:hypothetical protein